MQRSRTRDDPHIYASLLSPTPHSPALSTAPALSHPPALLPITPPKPVHTLARHEDANHKAEQRGDHSSYQPRLGPQRDGEDQTHEKREEIGPGRAPERLQLGKLGEQREQIHDHDGRERGVGDVDDDVGEDEEAQDDQQRRDEVVQRAARL